MNPHTYIGLPTIVQQMHKLGISMNVLEVEKDIKNIDLNDILNVVSDVCNIDTEIIKGNKRNRDYATARHLFFYIAKEHTKIDIETISAYINKDRGTGWHGHKKITNQLIYRDISWLVEKIESKLKTNK